MGYDDRREIFERLEALERMLRSRRDERGGGREHRHGDGGREHGRFRRGGGRDRDGGRDGLDEKRLVDTIVHLVCEHMERLLEDREARAPRGGGDEKRIIDTIVGLVSEHVREIVASELDRRLGRGDDGEAQRDDAGEAERG